MDNATVAGYTRHDFEVIRQDARQKWEERKADWIERLLWTTPHRARWMVKATSDQPLGFPLFDGTHILS